LQMKFPKTTTLTRAPYIPVETAHSKKPQLNRLSGRRINDTSHVAACHSKTISFWNRTHGQD
jgi:hypothetical protein